MTEVNKLYLFRIIKYIRFTGKPSFKKRNMHYIEFTRSKIIFIFTILLASIGTKGDVGLPTLYAVVNVTTNSGIRHEGIITLINASYDLQPNGIYIYQDEQYNWIKYFDYRFVKIDLINNSESVNEKNKLPAHKYFLLQFEYENSLQLSKHEISTSKEKEGIYLTDKTITQRKYKLLDSLTLMLEPEEYIDGKLVDGKKIILSMNEIATIEVSFHPSKTILEKINKVHEWYIKIGEEPDNTGDYIEPQWYHELAAIPNSLNENQEIYDKHFVR